MKRYAFITVLLLLLAAAWSAAAQDTAVTAEAETSVAEQPAEQPAEAAATPADDAAAMWEAANAAYVNGEYKRAADGYAAILERGVHSAELY